MKIEKWLETMSWNENSIPMTESKYWSSEKYYLGSTRTEYSLELKYSR